MDDEKIYKAAKLEYHVAIDSDKTKDFAFDCAIIEAIKQARASERAEITERLNRQWKLAYDLCEDRATQNGIKKGQAELIEKAEKASLQGDYDNAFVWVDTLERLASESLGEHGGLADGIGDKRCGKSNTRQSSSKDAGYKRSASPPSNPKPENALTPTTKEYEDAFKHIFSKPEKPKYTAGQYEGIPDHKNPYKIQEAKDLLAKASKPEKHIDGKSIADCKCPSCTKYREEWSDPEPNNSHCPFCGSTDLGFAREFRLNKDGTEDPATDCAGCNRIFYMRDYRVSK